MKLVMVLGMFLFIAVVHAETQKTYSQINAPDGIAIKGYDPVAYFDQEQPIRGRSEFQYSWNGAIWYFISESHRDQFAKMPEMYTPQYGGYCAYAVSRNYVYDADPEIWKIVDGRLYLNYSKDARKEWEKDIASSIRNANANWPAVLTKGTK